MQKNRATQFTGHKTYKLDPKGRVAFPSQWKTEEGGSFRVLRAQREGYPLYKCYTEASFEYMVNDVRQKAEAAGINNLVIEEYVGTIIGLCCDAELNSQGKFLVSKELREHLSLDEQLTLVGRGIYYEIWNPENYNAVYQPKELQKMELNQMFGIFS